MRRTSEESARFKMTAGRIPEELEGLEGDWDGWG